MPSSLLTPVQHLKISCLSRGLRLTKRAEDHLSLGGTVPLSIHEYVTTGGVTLVLPNDIYINAPFDKWYCDNPEAVLDLDEDVQGLVVYFRGEAFPAQALPLPGYLDQVDEKGRRVTNTVMSHTDRIRVSPIFGCSFRCEFCDFWGKKYLKRPAEQMLTGIRIARQDRALSAKHILISGGTPSARSYDYIDDVYQQVIEKSGLPVDVMLAPRKDNIVDRLADWGVHGYSINIEIYDPEIAIQLAPQKGRLGHSMYASSIEQAVARVGKTGRVRSLILVGLEPPESVIQGVEFLARLGSDPVLSPFRPAPGTRLENQPPPSVEDMERIYLESLDIVERYGVKLGPRCIPCQHNTLTLPDGSGAYYYS